MNASRKKKKGGPSPKDESPSLDFLTSQFSSRTFECLKQLIVLVNIIHVHMCMHVTELLYVYTQVVVVGVA